MPEPKLIKWKSFDGRLISGFLYLPPGETKAPRAVIIDIHGGPEFQVRPDFRGVDNYFTLRLGIAMIYPNIRGSTGYGKAFSGLDNGIHRQDAVKDIGALLGWIERQPQLDAKRVVVRGESYGGYVAFSVAADYSPRIKGSIANIGPSNLVTFLEHTDISVRDQRRAEFGDERDPKVREILERISPLHNANRVTNPLLVIHGKGDPRVPYSQSDQMVAAVRKVGTQVWYLLSQNEGHGLSGDSGMYSLCAQALFVSKVLMDN